MLNPLPFSQRWPPIRVFLLISAVLLMPVIAALILSLLSFATTWFDMHDGAVGTIIMILWMAAIAAVVLTVPKTKICESCGWRSSRRGV